MKSLTKGSVLISVALLANATLLAGHWNVQGAPATSAAPFGARS